MLTFARSVVLAVGVLAAAPAGATEGSLRVKLSDVAPDAAPGEVRRTVQPFGTWTLVCDENLRKRQRVCNVSQQIVDAPGRTAFSWSLAGTRGGAPVMILRVPAEEARARFVEVAFGADVTTRVALTTCDHTLCLGFLPVSPTIGRALRRKGTAEIVLMRDGRLATLELPLKDLSTAVEAMRTR